MKKGDFFAFSIVGSYFIILGEHLQKIWRKLLNGLLQYSVWNGRKRFFSSCPTRAAKFDCPWSKNFQLHKLKILYHLNPHQTFVRYFCTKSWKWGMNVAYSNYLAGYCHGIMSHNDLAVSAFFECFWKTFMLHGFKK